MKGRIITAQGAVYALPELIRWRICRTGGVPCDSFEAVCLYRPEMAEVLDAACRFEAVEDGRVYLRGVIDEWSAEVSEDGRLLTLAGRGLAALLLDSDTEAAVYQWAGVQEIVRRYVTPSGIACVLPEGRYGTGQLRVSAGASRWRAVESFCARCGLEAVFTGEGTLRLVPRGALERRTLGVGAGLIEARWRDRRYGVLSAVTAISSSTGARARAVNEAFIARGGQCERVLYGKDAGLAAARERLAASRAGKRELVLVLAGTRTVEPRERVTVSLAALGIAGEFRVSEVVRALDAHGERTEITLWEE